MTEQDFEHVHVIFALSIVQLVFAVLPFVTEWLRTTCCKAESDVTDTMAKGSRLADGAAT